MSIARCAKCERPVDTDVDEMVEVNGEELCENCVPCQMCGGTGKVEVTSFDDAKTYPCPECV